ncbi:hypothetical protein P692DRAFT_20823943, partial [Suillus brevipes Sb2]
AILDSEDAIVNLALYPAGYQPIPLVSDLTCDLIQAPFISLNVLESRVRSPTINRLRFDPIVLASRAHSSVADSSESGLLGSGSIAERAAVIHSVWPETLIRCNLQLKDLERDDDTLPDADILTLNKQGSAWFSLFMYDNKRQVSASIVTTRAGFDLTHIFGVALHDKIMSIISRLTPPQSDCLPLA